MRSLRTLALGLCPTLLALATAGTALAQMPRAELPTVSVPEVANDIAVADTGTSLLSFRDLKQVGVVDSDGALATIDLGCEPMAVAIHPDGIKGWAVCASDPHVYVLDLVTPQVSVAGLDLVDPVELAYSPAQDLLVAGGMSGQIVVIDAAGDNYIKKATFSIGGDLSALTLARDGTTGFAASYVSQISRIDLLAGTAQTLDIAGGAISMTSLSLSPSGATLYAAGAKGGPSPVPDSVVLALDPTTGAVLQEKTYVMSPAGFGAITLVACHRTLYFGTGLGVDIGTMTTGVFGIELDTAGRLGDLVGVVSQPVFANTMDVSPSCTRGSAVSTDRELFRWTAEDAPYPSASIDISGSLSKGRITLTGLSTGLASGTKVSVYIKVAGKKGATFVKQKKQAVVGTDGRFTWKGAVTGPRVSVYVKAGTLKSTPIVVRGR